MLFKDRKLGTKLYMGFAAGLALMLLTATMGYIGMKNNNDYLATYRGMVNDQRIAGEIQSDLLNCNISFNSLMQTGDATQVQEFEKYHINAEKLITEFKKNVNDPEMYKRINGLSTLEKLYNDNFKSFTEFSELTNNIYKNTLLKYEKSLEQRLALLANSAQKDNNLRAAFGFVNAAKHLLLCQNSVDNYFHTNLWSAIGTVNNEMLEFDKWMKYSQNAIIDSEMLKDYKTVAKEKSLYYKGFYSFYAESENRNILSDKMAMIGPILSQDIHEIRQFMIEEQEKFKPIADANYRNYLIIIIVMALFALGVSGLISFLIVRTVTIPVRTVTKTFRAISEGVTDLSVRLKSTTHDEIGQMSSYFNSFMDRLQTIFVDINKQYFIKAGLGKLNEKLSGEQDINTLCENIIAFLCRFLNAQIGAIYVRTETSSYKMISGYAFKKDSINSNEILLGEGLVGQCAIEKKVMIITDVPDDYIKISSGVGETSPSNIIIMPCVLNERALCIIEIGSLKEFGEQELQFIEQIEQSIAIGVNSALSRSKMKELLEKTVEQSEELQVQQEELKQSNEELEEQTRALRESQLTLTEQQEELRRTNEELEEHTNALRESEMRLQLQQKELQSANESLEERARQLEMQKKDISETNEVLRKAQDEIEKQTEALRVESKYKSEFLANMSHELRTPLNSILVLSQLIATSEENAAITGKEIEFAETIHSSGNDLLSIINDILDLSKVESGKMDIIVEPLLLSEVIKFVNSTFGQLAIGKGISFNTNIEDNLTEQIQTDSLRLYQIIKNLLANAFKFTEGGSVSFTIRRPLQNEVVDSVIVKEESVCFAITDTGIGISEDKQSVIFEAFKQSDGTTSRRYGGTGLGLSISRELAKLLGGKIHLVSKEGKGSTFSLIIPEIMQKVEEFTDEVNAVDESTVIPGNDKAAKKNENIKSLKKLGNTESLGKTFTEAKEYNKKAYNKMLIVSKDLEQSEMISDIFKGRDIEIKAIASGQEALQLLEGESFNCLVIDFELEDVKIFEFLGKVRKGIVSIPIIIYTGKEISKNDTDELQRYTDSIIIKGPKSEDRLLEEAMLFLHGTERKTDIKIKSEKLTSSDKTVLKDKKILIIDDDMRNVFALSNVLESKGLKVVVGKNGKEGIEKLESNRDVDLILMDIMMPEMDGYTAMKKIRENKEWGSSIPIIALTAKAMKEDRKKCIDAGANDYLTKPINIDKLISLIRVWVYR